MAAEAACEQAIARAPRHAGHRVALGNLAFARGDMPAAEARYRDALALAPFSASIHNNLAQALKRQGRLSEALGHFRQSLELGRGSRWFSRSALMAGRPDPLRADSFTHASRAKLDHDIEQFEHLIAKGELPAAFADELEAYRAVRDVLPAAAPCRAVALDEAQRSSIEASYNRVVHLPRRVPAPAEPLAAWDAGAVAQAYAMGSPRLAVVDDFLDDAALAQLRAFCLDATIWFDCKADDGYLGAYLHEGFDAPVLLAIADALRTRLPGIFGGLELTQMWAFKYRPEGRGTRPHADQAAVNLNFWITPDDAALPGRAGGLRVWDEPAPAEWTFDAYNRDPAPIEAHLARSGACAIDVPYRCNRAVIFDSSLFHESLPFAFRPGYANRRINVTMLFGRRREAPQG
ncbi:MAG: tetratricopeptide repeat protein [Alphaproteobacteria bacterium]